MIVVHLLRAPQRGTWPWFVFTVLWGLALCFTTARASAQVAYQTAPPAAWVRPLAVVVPAAGGADNTLGGQRYLIVDTQTNLAVGALVQYRHFAFQVTSAAGVEQNSDVSMTIEPTYEKLTIHHVDILRGATRRSALVPGAVRSLRDASDADHLLYNARVTARVLLPDMRVGDVVDFAYTIAGDHPAFVGQYSDDAPLGYSDPTSQISYRILVKPSRALAFRVVGGELAPQLQESGGIREYLWSSSNVRAYPSEDRVPADVPSAPRLYVGDAASWASIATARAKAYDAVPKTGQLITEKAREFAAQSADKAEQALAAIRFVQDEVRYLGIEVGVNTVDPHPPEKVLAQRFGDCKDKAFLLVALLEAMGVQASVALVHSRRGAGLQEALPSSNRFNHAITYLVVDGHAYWVDVTVSHQGGTLQTLEVPAFHYGLLVRSDTTQLLAIEVPANETATTSVVEDYRVLANTDGGPQTTELAVVSTFRGVDADDNRSRFASDSHVKIARTFLEFYAKDEPNIRAGAPLAVEDNRRANTFVVREQYFIENYLRDGAARFHASSLGELYAPPRTVLRTLPFTQGFPHYVHHEVHMHLPWATPSLPETVQHTTEDVYCQRHVSTSPGAIDIVWYGKTMRAIIPANGVATYVHNASICTDSLFGAVTGEVGAVAVAPDTSSATAPDLVLVQPDPHPWRSFLWTVLPASVVVFGVLLIAFGPAAWRKSRWNARKLVLDGEAPATATRAATFDDALAMFAKRKCKCGKLRAPALGALSATHMLFAEKQVTCVKSTCVCGEVARHYFIVGESTRT
jgi:transglutaminase-like putative cysteine protease